MKRLLLLLCLLLSTNAWAGFGAVGQKVEYRVPDLALPYTGQGKVLVVVNDLRPYLLLGEKPAAFVGIMRGGFGNTFDVKTVSGQPLPTDMRDSLVGALTRAGFNAVPETFAAGETLEAARARLGGLGADRILVVQLREWKTDTYSATKLTYDVTFTVFDGAGQPLGNIEGKDERPLDVKQGFSAKKVLADIAANWRTKLADWMAQDAIRTALGGQSK
jgi:hypothetical protein